MNVEGRTFTNETVDLDGTSFSNCAFRNCELRFAGGIPPSLSDCSFDGCSWGFDGGAAATIGLLASMYRVQKWKALVVDLIHQISAGEFGVPMGGPYDPHLQRAQDVPAYHGPVTRERNPSRGIYTTDCTNVRTENTRIQGYDQGIVDERGFNIHHSGDRIFAPGEIAAVRTALANARREIQDAPLLAFQKHRALAEIEKAEKEPTPSRLSRVSQTLSGLFKATGKLAENAPAISAIVSQISRFLGN